MKEIIKDKLYEFRGSANILTSLSLEQLAVKVSDVLCKGQSFTFGKHSFWEEIPSMFIEHPFLGMIIIIGGYGGESGFQIEIQSTTSSYLYENELSHLEIKINLDLYLYHLLNSGLKDDNEISVKNPMSI